jgi:hypothetical protein
LFLFCRTCLPLVESGLVTVASGLLLFTFKAGYVQPELSYWVLNTILFALLGKMLLSPSWRLAVVCGLLSVVTYFIKAGTQPLLLLFVVTWMIKLLWDWFSYRRRSGRGRLDEGEEAPRVPILFAQGASVIAIYLVLLTPYFIGTKKQFGDPFYSVYTEYMMWLPMDEGEDFLVDRDYMWAFYYAGARSRRITVEEFNASLQRTVRSRLKKEGKGKLSDAELDARVAERYKPAAALPNRADYFELYPPSHGVERVQSGLRMLQKRIRKYYKRAMGMGDLVIKLALAALLLHGLISLWDRYLPGRRFVVEDRSPPGALRRACARRPYVFFYVLGFFVGYLVLYAWYDALGIGPRLMLSLYLPLLFTAVLAAHYLFRGLVVPNAIARQPIYLGRVANLILLVALTYLSFKLMTGELYQYTNTGG